MSRLASRLVAALALLVLWGGIWSAQGYAGGVDCSDGAVMRPRTYVYCRPGSIVYRLSCVYPNNLVAGAECRDASGTLHTLRGCCEPQFSTSGYVQAQVIYHNTGARCPSNQMILGGYPSCTNANGKPKY